MPHSVCLFFICWYYCVIFFFSHTHVCVPLAVYNYRLFTTITRSYLPHFLLVGFGLRFAGLFVEIIFSTDKQNFSLLLFLSLSVALLHSANVFFSLKVFVVVVVVVGVFVLAFNMWSGMFTWIFFMFDTTSKLYKLKFDRIEAFWRWYTCYGILL